MTTPTTAAGPLTIVQCPHGTDRRYTPRCYLCKPLAIEAEAVAAERKRIAEAVEAAIRDARFPTHYSLDESAGAHANFLLGAQEIQTVILRAVLAIVKEQP